MLYNYLSNFFLVFISPISGIKDILFMSLALTLMQLIDNSGSKGTFNML